MQLSSIRGQTERLRPPRALYCNFPLGRPLGRPGDPRFQRQVLDAAFTLLERTSGPVLEDFPVAVLDESHDALSCTIPPRYDPSVPPAVDEARALRTAYERQRSTSGRTNVGLLVGPDAIPEVVGAFVRIAEGTPWREAGLPGDPRRSALDVRCYFEEAAMALADRVPAARQAESWVFSRTQTGSVLKRAQRAIRDSGADREDWLYLIPSTQQEL